MAAATPDLSERIAWLSEAADLLEPSAARLEAAHTLVELGTALVDRGDKEEARGVLRRGANLASLSGAHQLVEEAGIQLRAAGARPRRLGIVGPDSLTPAELRVVRLAAAGKTNQGIAADLYVSVKTVEGHLAKAYRKLGVDSRQSLAPALDSGDEPEELLGSPAV
jgi:DNA-binding NarL/FixJ family response regulator